MGESVDSVLASSVWKAGDILDSNVAFLEDDIDALTEFQEEVERIDLSTNGSSDELLMNGSGQPYHTEKVIELFDDLFYSRQNPSERVENNAEKFGLSMPAAHFLQELLNVANINETDAVTKMNFLDSKNDMGPSHIREVVSLAEYPKANRREVAGEIGVYETSLREYQDELNGLDNRVVEINEEYTLPLDLDEAVEVVRELESVENSIDQLEKRRKHELRRMSDIITDYTLETIDTYFNSEEFDEPVLYDIDTIRENIYEAKENIQIR